MLNWCPFCFFVSPNLTDLILVSVDTYKKVADDFPLEEESETSGMCVSK